MNKHTTLKAKFNSAFSLVELLVVIAVIAVIAAIAIPNITGARDAAVAAQGSYDTAQYKQMSNQLVSMGYTGSITPAALSNGITNPILDATGAVLTNVVFKLGK